MPCDRTKDCDRYHILLGCAQMWWEFSMWPYGCCGGGDVQRFSSRFRECAISVDAVIGYYSDEKLQLQAKSPLAIDAELWWRKKCGQHYHIQTGEPCWGSLVAVCGSNLWHKVCNNRSWEIFPVHQAVSWGCLQKQRSGLAWRQRIRVWTCKSFALSLYNFSGTFCFNAVLNVAIDLALMVFLKQVFCGMGFFYVGT